MFIHISVKKNHKRENWKNGTRKLCENEGTRENKNHFGFTNILLFLLIYFGTSVK